MMSLGLSQIVSLIVCHKLYLFDCLRFLLSVRLSQSMYLSDYHEVFLHDKLTICLHTTVAKYITLSCP
jgi:hypothetical protein